MLHKCQKQIQTVAVLSCSGGAYLHSLHWLYLVEKLKSAHIITFDFYFHLQHSKAHLHSCQILSLTLFISICPSLSFPVTLSLSLSVVLSFYLSFLRSVFHVTPLAGVAEGELMASLSGVLAAVLLQLLGGYTGSSSWASSGVHHSSCFEISSSFFCSSRAGQR